MILSVPVRDGLRGDEGERAPAAADLGASLDRDRRAGTERIIEFGRWMVLLFGAFAANLPVPLAHHAAEVNTVLGAWGAFNLAVTLMLIAGRIPGRRLQYLMTGVDVGVATALVSLTGGYSSSFGIVFYAVVIAASLRFGLFGSLVCVLLVSTADLLTGTALAGGIDAATFDGALSHVFLYLVVAVTSSLLARELVNARSRQLEHSYRLEHAAFVELREIDRLKSDFIMLASHELRTPLTKVKGWLTLIEEHGDRLPPEAHAEGLAVLHGETERLARLTDNLLCIAQLEAGEIRLKTGPVNTRQLLEQMLNRFIESGERGRCQVEVAAEARTLLADRERLGLAVACLVDNALKFSSGDEPVRVSATRHGDEVQIAVRDWGKRIPDDQRDRVFQSFYQLEAPLLRQRGGAGVGLYLARQLVQRMGGRIWIDNSRARGNTFCLTLPADT